MIIINIGFKKILKGGENMEATALIAVLNGGPVKLSGGKKGTQKATDGFENILLGFGAKSKEDPKAEPQDLNAVILQLLALLNMIQPQNEAGGTEGGENNDLNRNTLLTQITANIPENAEIGRLWKQLTSSFSSEGKFDEVVAAKFYEALTASVPELSKPDVHAFMEQLKNLLSQKPDGQNAFSGSVNTAKDNIAAVEPFDSSQTGGSRENVEQSDSMQMRLSPAKNVETSENVQADSTIEGAETKVVEKVSSKEPEKVTDIVKTASDATEGLQTEKAVNSTAKSDIPILESFLGEVPAGNKTGINEKVQMFQKSRPFAAETFEQLVDNVRLAIRDGTREMSIKLKPDSLGNVMIKIFSDGDKLTAELFVENAYVHEAMQYHAQELKNQIQQHGYNLAEVNVYQTSDWQTGNFNNGDSQQKNDYRSKKYRYNYTEKDQVEEIAAKSMYDGWANTGSINYVV